MASRGLEYIISLKDQLSAPLKEVTGEFDKLGNAITAITGIGVAFAGAALSVGAFVDNSLTALDEIYQLQNVTKVAANEIYNWGKIAEVNGSGAEAAQSSIEGLTKVIGEASLGLGKGAKAFEYYGFKAKKADGTVKTATEMLEEIRSKMEGMAEAEQVAMLAKLGIDKSLIQTLRLTSKEMEKAKKQAVALSLGVGNPDNAKAAAEFKDALTLLQQAVKGVAEYLSVKLAPKIKEIIELFIDWFVVNNDFVKETLDTVALAVGNLIKFVFKMIRAIDSIIQSTIGWQGALLAVVTVLAVTKKAMIQAFLTNPVTQMAAGILALILLVEDLLVYMQGGNSYFSKKWEPLVGIIKSLQTYFAKFQPFLTDFIAKMKSLAPVIAGVVAGAYALKGIFALISPVLGLAKTAAVLFFNVLKVGFLSSPIGWIVTAIGTIVYLFKDELAVIIPNIIAGFQDWGLTFSPIWEAFGLLGEAIAPIITGIAELFGLTDETTQGMSDLGKTGETIGKVIAIALQVVINGLSLLVYWVAEGIKFFTNLFKDIINGATKVYNFITGLFGGEPIKVPFEVQQVGTIPVMQANNVAGATMSIAQTVAGVSTATAPQITPINGATPKSFAPTNGKTVSNLTNNNQRTITNHITVNANAEPREIANAIKQAEARELS